MREDTKNKIFITAYIIAVLFVVILAIAAIILHVYALIKYGNTPVTDAPVWVYWILDSRK